MTHILSHGIKASYDVVVVGAGTSGAVVASRISERGDRRVLLVEAGGPASQYEDIVRDGETVRGAIVGHELNWSRLAELTPGRDYTLAGGRTVGGSGAINGGILHWPRPRDFANWEASVSARWGAAQALRVLQCAVHDLDANPRSPQPINAVPMRRVPQASISSAALRRAALALGVPDEPDKNSGGTAGVGPVSRNVVDGVRQVPAHRLLAAARALEVRTDCAAERILMRAGRVMGVALRDGITGVTETVLAGEVVVAAGSIGTPTLLLRSGIGPAEALRSLDLDVVVDHPTLGMGQDHPNLMLKWALTAPEATVASFPTAVHVEGLGADTDACVEVLLVDRSPGSLLTLGGGATDVRGLLVGLSSPELPSEVSLKDAAATSPPRIRHRYLATDTDRRRAREGVRFASALLSMSPMADIVAQGPTGLRRVEGNDAELDAWIMANVGTAFHLVGTARMGSHSDPDAVTDEHGRLRGVEGLRIADVSLLPTAPTRGPAASALLTGARVADSIIG